MNASTETKVKDVMSRQIFAVGKNEKLYDAIRLMEAESLSAVPVIDTENKVCGILSTTDIVRAVATPV